MDTITITTENKETYSTVSNFFIDYYMADANGEYVKIYLYLVRLLHSGQAFTISDIANHFHVKDKEICKAIHYWIKQNVLRIDYNSEKKLTGITLLPLISKEIEDEISIFSMLGITDDESKIQTINNKELINKNVDVTHKEQQDEKSKTAERIPSNSLQFRTAPKKQSYTPARLEEKYRNTAFKDIQYVAETCLGTTLSLNNINTLSYIYDDLSFSQDLIEYLIEYCAVRDKKSMNYIEKVAIDWYQDNITNVEEAKLKKSLFDSKYYSVFKALGIDRKLTPTDTKYIDTWYDTYAFDSSIIQEACDRTVKEIPHKPTLKYVDGILKKWYNAGVKNFSDIKREDEKHEEERKKKQSVSKQTVKINQFNNYQQSTTNEVLSEFENLFLQETNQ